MVVLRLTILGIKTAWKKTVEKSVMRAAIICQFNIFVICISF